MASAPNDIGPRTIWDWSLRLFHWSLALSIFFMWLTADQGEMEWHRRIGLFVLGLLVYRIYWGLAGPRTARFSSLKLAPRHIASYLPKLFKRPYTAEIGHNPLGSLSVIALLGAALFQVSSGLFSIDVDGLESGPLAVFVSFDLGRDIADIHELNFNIVLTFIGLHLCAIAYYTVYLRAKLISAMVTGSRETNLAAADAASPQIKAGIVHVLVGIALSAAVVTAIVKYGS